jgi:hypothetical protein
VTSKNRAFIVIFIVVYFGVEQRNLPMNKDHAELYELETLLSDQLTQSAYDRSSKQPERFLIDHLVEQVQDWGIGRISTQELRAAFSEHDLGNFNIDQWISTKVAEGVYVLDDDDET